MKSKTARKSMGEVQTNRGSLPPGTYHVEVVRGTCPNCRNKFRMGVATEKGPATCRACQGVV